MKRILHYHEIKTPQGPAYPGDNTYYEEELIPETLEEKINYLMEQVDYLHKKEIKREKDSMYRREDLEMLYGSW